MKIGFLSIDECIPPRVAELFFTGENEWFVIENRALERALMPYIAWKKTSLTILPGVCAFTEQASYLAQIEALMMRCELLVCFAKQDCAQLQWCLEYMRSMKMDVAICWA